MAGARLRVARRQRQGTSWMRLLVIGILAVVGGAVLWNGLQYSSAHDHSAGELRRSTEQAGEGADQGSTSKSETSMDAWTQLTELPGTSSGDGGAQAGSSSSSSGGSQQRKKDDAGQLKEGETFLTVKLRVPKMPPTFNSWVQTEDMLLFHLRSLQQQLEQTYVAMALAAATGRTFVLPEFSCFCQNSDAPLPRCRRPDSEKLQFPAACREGEVLVLPPDFAAEPGARGMALEVRPPSLMQALEAAGGQDAELVVRPSAQILFPKCKELPPNPDPAAASAEACVRPSTREGEAEGVLLVPPSLNDTDLLPLVAPLQKYRLWRLDLSDIGSHWHAFQGWDCAEPAHQFDRRMSNVVKPWPSPEAAAAAAGGEAAGGGAAAKVNLKMTFGRVYSDEPDMKQECGGSEGGAGAAAGAATAAASRR